MYFFEADNFCILPIRSIHQPKYKYIVAYFINVINMNIINMTTDQLDVILRL